MGYKHCWSRPAEIDRETFQAMADDFRKLLRPLRGEGVRLGDAFGEGRPVCSHDQVVFNGIGRCGCRRQRSKGADLVLSLFFESQGDMNKVRGNLGDLEDLHDLDWAERRCSGSCTFESFHFPRVVERTYDTWEPGRAYDSCKTNRRPYDLAVTSFLVIARHHLGDALEVTSDSRERWWDEPRELCQRILGYGRGTRVARLWGRDAQGA